MVSRHVDDAHLMPGGAAGCAGATFARLRSASTSLSKYLTNFCFYVPGSGCVPPSMVLSGRARALRACGATIHPYTWVAWCMQALELCPGVASLEAVGEVLSRYQAREEAHQRVVQGRGRSRVGCRAAGFAPPAAHGGGGSMSGVTAGLQLVLNMSRPIDRDAHRSMS